jgi:cell wall-associated NlpC family hydrolase
VSANKSRIPTTILVGVLAAVAGGLGVLMLIGPGEAAPGGDAGATASTREATDTAASEPSANAQDYTYERKSSPARTVVTSADGEVIATFTDGARTVVVNGKERIFEEPELSDASVTTNAWVRLAPKPWSRGAVNQKWFEPWLKKQVGSTKPDVLEVATQYFTDAPDVVDDKGRRIAGDAAFGPPDSSGESRLEANDFYDYMGVDWTFDDGTVEQADPKRLGALDCSGYIRMVFGVRLGYPLLGTNEPGPGLPRRAYAMADFGPGALLIDDEGKRPPAQELDGLRPGDLVFFVTDDVPGIDHSGIYLGVDSEGEHRFMSSRGTINGPTLGDVAGPSVLDGDGLFATNFRAARRV